MEGECLENGRGWKEGLPWKVGVRARSTVSVGLNSECSDKKRKTFVLQRWEGSLAEARIREPRNKAIRTGLGQEWKGKGEWRKQ